MDWNSRGKKPATAIGPGNPRFARLAVASVVVAAIASVTPLAASSARLNCGSVGFEAGSENGTGSILARGTTCSAARRVARGSAPSSPRHGPYSYRGAGFQCRGRDVIPQVGLDYIQFTCTRVNARVTFARY